MFNSGFKLASRAIPGIAAAALLLGLSACAVLDEELDGQGTRPVVGEGGRVVGLSGSYAYREDDIQERELFTLRGTVDQFLTDNHVVGAYALGQFSNVEEDTDGREQLWTGLHYHYHYHLNERTSIYGGPQLGLTFFDDAGTNDQSFTYGISGGFRHWLTDRVAFTIEPSILFADFKERNGDDSEDFLLLWGLAFSL